MHGPDTDDNELAALRDAFPGYRFRRRFVRGVLCRIRTNLLSKQRGRSDYRAARQLFVAWQVTSRRIQQCDDIVYPLARYVRAPLRSEPFAVVSVH